MTYSSMRAEGFSRAARRRQLELSGRGIGGNGNFRLRKLDRLENALMAAAWITSAAVIALAVWG